MMSRYRSLHRWVEWFVLLAALAGVGYWGHTYVGRASSVRLAAGGKDGYAYGFAAAFKNYFEKHTRYRVHILTTGGSIDNRARLLAGEADLALIIPGLTSFENLAMVAPLWENYIHVMVSKHAGIRRLKGFPGRNVALGEEGTAERDCARKVLDHYGLSAQDLTGSKAGLEELRRDNSYEAAIIAASLMDPALHTLMKSGRFRLLPLAHAEGLAFHYPYLETSSIPPGLYPTADGPLPEQEIGTVTGMTILAARPELSDDIAEAALETLDGLHLPHLLTREQLEEKEYWKLLDQHRAARRYFNPMVGFHLLSKLVHQAYEVLELIVVIVIAGGIIAYKWLVRKKVRREKAFKKEARALEDGFQELLRLDGAQKRAKDIRLLRRYLDETVKLKEETLNRVRGKDIAHGNLFLAFVQESSHIIQDIEWKLTNRITEKGVVV